MEVKVGPNSLDEPNILYKLQRKIKVFNTNNPFPNFGYNLVASSSKYGIVFVVAPNNLLSVYYLKDLINKECEASHVQLKLQLEPTHIAVNCDQEWLALISTTMLFVYKIADFQNQNILPSFSIKLDVNPSTSVSSVQWNPCVSDTIAIAFLDGTILVSQVNTMQVKKLIANVRCICWSPKGKQIVTGNNDGTLCQYKPDLSPMKIVPAPDLFEGAKLTTLAIYWISTYQFAVVYKNATDSTRPAVTIVNTSKGGPPSCVNYEDICYSMGSSRPWYYYLHGLAQWNMILASSSNSMEIATLGSTDGANWLQWCQVDEARPELPLTNKTQENYPLGLCIDTSAIHQLPWGENETLPPMPMLLVLSQTGVLTIFNIVNLKKEAPCICTPPQQLTLSASLMTSTIPEDIKSEPINMTQPAPTEHYQHKPFDKPFASPAQTFDVQKPQPTTEMFSKSVPQPIETKPIDTKPQVPAVQNPPSVAPPQPVIAAESPKPQTPIQAQEINALKTEQERVNKMKANEELKNMLIKEVNDFQMELYKFVVKSRESHIKLQKDVESITTEFSIQPKDIEQLKIDCSIEELRDAIVQLKLDLVRACAVVAELRTHTDTKHLLEWSQADPLTTKRVASVKKLAYYVQNQLDQAHRALDHKWNEMSMRNPNEKPGQRMLRPILDDIYQPLVKQQEILSRQQAVLRSLRNTLKECGDVAPVFKTTNILRSTPFRNKGDPLSKLTKNILNMSIEPEKDKSKDQKAINQKLDALRDMLANHKTVKIKPVNVELKQQLTTLRRNYEKSLKEKEMKEREKAAQEAKMKVEVQSPKVEPSPFVPDFKTQNIKLETKPVAPITVPSYTPVSNTKTVKPPIANVARTLFTEDESKPEPANLIANQQQKREPLLPTPVKPEVKETTNQTVAPTTRILLKGMLQNKSQTNAEKNDANTFMGQKICSPNAFSFSANSAAPSAVFTAKPIADMNNMLSKLQPQTFTAEPKSSISTPQSSETGEIVMSVQKPPLETKTPTNAFTLKPAAPQSQSNVPDVLKTTTQTSNFSKTEEKVKEASKENVPTKANEKPTKEPQKLVEENQPKTFNLSIKPAASLSNAQPTAAQAAKPEVKSETTTSDSAVKPTSIFSGSGATLSVSKPLTVFGGTSSLSFAAKTTSEQTKPSETSTASSIFGQAVASQKASSPESKSPTSGSIFASSGTSVFGSSIFGKSTSTTTTSTAQSVFSAASTAMTSSLATTTQSSSETASVTTTASSTPVISQDQTAVSTTPTTTSTAPVTTTPTMTSQANAQDANVPAPVPVFGGTASSTKPVFGSTTTTTSSLWSFSTSTQSSIFGTATTTSTQSVFGSTATPSTQASILGTQKPTPTQTSVFGTTTPSTQASIFGSQTTASTPAPVFGTQAATASTQASVFGSQTTPSTQASIFGSQTPTPSTQASVFDSQTAAQSTPASVFGSQTTPSTQTSLFGSQSTPTTQASVFGSQTTPSTQTSVFGSQSTPSTQAPLFGSSSQSVFGSSNTTAFAPTTTQSSLFGNTESLFAAASISTTSASSPTSGGSIFGSSGGTSVFGNSNTNVFGGKSTFGQSNQSAASIFGGANTTLKQSNTNFWGSNASGGNTFGSNTFGQQATTQASLFSGSTGGSFSTPSTGQPLGSPQNAFGATEAKPSVFGSPQQTSPSFGGSPVFGSKPVFGQSAGFGSPTSQSGFGGFGGFNKSPTTGFGAPAAFGAPAFGGSAFGGTSPGKMFGGAPAATGFGSPTQSNSTFESLATQNTLTFGNLAQQSGQQSSPQQPTFNTAPSFTGWRG